MTIERGVYAIGPDVGTVRLHTGRHGVAARAGHDLVLLAQRWRGNLTIDPDRPEASAVEVSIEAASLEVERAAGLRPLLGRDRSQIHGNIAKVLRARDHPEITFRSSAVTQTSPGVTVEGDLTLLGTTRSLTLHVTSEDIADGLGLVAIGEIVQTAFGIKPFSTMLGALQVNDAVAVTVELRLRATPLSG